jgi:hypothetical protein
MCKADTFVWPANGPVSFKAWAEGSFCTGAKMICKGELAAYVLMQRHLQSYCICRHLWRLVDASYQAFRSAHDSLLDLLYRMALIRPLRDLFDQIIPDMFHQHPLQILVKSWHFLVNSRGRGNIHAARSFWLLLRTLCCVLPSPVPMEPLTIRHALSVGGTPFDLAKQDAHLRAALPEAELRVLSNELQQLPLASSKTLHFLAECLERTQQLQQHPVRFPDDVRPELRCSGCSVLNAPWSIHYLIDASILAFTRSHFKATLQESSLFFDLQVVKAAVTSLHNFSYLLALLDALAAKHSCAQFVVVHVILWTCAA